MTYYDLPFIERLVERHRIQYWVTNIAIQLHFQLLLLYIVTTFTTNWAPTFITGCLVITANLAIVFGLVSYREYRVWHKWRTRKFNAGDYVKLKDTESNIILFKICTADIDRFGDLFYGYRRIIEGNLEKYTDGIDGPYAHETFELADVYDTL